jgi:hypothetical protein
MTDLRFDNYLKIRPIKTLKLGFNTAETIGTKAKQ